jgi:N-glycosylase/DNA lyase
MNKKIEMNRKEINEITGIYSSIKNDIESQIGNFRKVWETGDDFDVFVELVFCILTPQSKAIMADRIIKNLKKKKLFFTDDGETLSGELNLVRFKNHKAEYIIEARRFLTDHKGKIRIREKIDPSDLFVTREWIVDNIKGIGFKEASHFLRNIGFGDDLAILDRHILKNLKKLGVIDDIPKTLSKKNYYEIEKSLIEFSKKIKIPAGHFDFVLWYRETGFIFK